MRKQLFSDDLETSDWMTVDPPIGNTMLLGMPIDDFEALGAGNSRENFQKFISINFHVHFWLIFQYVGFDDYEIFNGGKDDEEENGE